MARITNEEVNIMKREILNDLYLKTDKDLEIRKKQLTAKNRELYLKTYKEVISKLPQNLLNFEDKYRIDISYPWNRVSEDSDQTTSHSNSRNWRYLNHEKDAQVNYIKETWEIDLKDRPVSPKYRVYDINGTWTDRTEIEPELKKEAEEICEESIALINERAKMGLYLEEVLGSNRTHKRLREALPSSLQKYIPVETKSNKSKGVGSVEVAKPDFLDERLTTNLLEDN